MGIKEAFTRDLFEYYEIKSLFHISHEKSVTVKLFFKLFNTFHFHFKALESSLDHQQIRLRRL